MPITFNGHVTINGNMEIYENGSVKISDNNIVVDSKDLKNFIDKILPYSVNKIDYIQAADTINNSNDKGLIENAFRKLMMFFQESGKAFWISGLSQIAQEVAKSIGQHIK